MALLRNGSAIRREITAAQRIPYAAHVAPSVISSVFGDYIQVFRLGGASFETSDDGELNNWHERLNVLWRNIASPNVAVWTHVIRRRARVASDAGASGAMRQPDVLFADALHEKYHRRLANHTLMANEIYLAIVHRPTSGMATGLVSKAIARGGRASSQPVLTDALDTCEKLSQTMFASLARYEPELLGAYQAENIWCSSLLEYLGLLINGEWQRAPLPTGPVNRALATSRLLFGTEAIEYRLPTATRVGAMLGIKEYPTPSIVGMFNRLLAAPFSFVATQSFSFLTKSTAQSLLQRQFNRMANAGDFAVSQAAELKDALDALTSNEFAMGDHHFSLQVLADVAEPGADASRGNRLKTLNDCIALARSILADTGMLVAREDFAQVSSLYGAGEGQTIVENCANTLILRCSGSENGGTSQFASRLIGEREILRRQVSRGKDRETVFSARGARRSRSITDQHVTEIAVMPSELEQLPDLCGYLKGASSAVWLKVAFTH